MKWFLACLIWFSTLAADNIIELRGYLGATALQGARQEVEKSLKQDPSKVVFVLSSTSADLNEVIKFAREIYSQRAEKKFKVVFYIDDTAIGPSAILPFLSDELITSPFVTWGAIPLGEENTLPNNILRNRVFSLIGPENPKEPLLELLANAMVDPAIDIVEDKDGWYQARVDDKRSYITVKGETLVLNQNQLRELKLVTQTLSLEQFLKQFNATLPQEDVKKLDKSDIDERLAKYIKFDPKGQNLIGRILIDDRTSGINQSTWIYVKNALDHFKEHKPLFVILELNTPGGEVYASQKISDALKELDSQYGIPVIAYINNWAISAGAMLAYSSRFIAVVKDASMGAAEPVIQSESGQMQSASEKVNSALRADFANRAAYFDRNPLIAEAMVDKDLILVVRHGQIVKLDNANQIRTIGPDPDYVLSQDGKLLTLNANQLIQYKVADFLVEPKPLELITDIEKQEGKWPAKKMLLFQNPFLSELGEATVETYDPDWKTEFFMFLASPLISSLLFLGLMVGIYMEINAPGVSLPGTIAFVCLFLIILSSFSQELTSWLEVILLFSGLLIILIEIFVLPTFGFLGFIGLIFFLMGLFSIMLPGIGSIDYDNTTKTVNAAGELFLNRLLWLAGTFFVGIVTIALLARFFLPKFAGFKKFVLHGSEQEGYVAGENLEDLPKVGDEGTAYTPLRPSGKVLIQDKIYDAMSSGSFIERETIIVVTRVSGSEVIVREKK